MYKFLTSTVSRSIFTRVVAIVLLLTTNSVILAEADPKWKNQAELGLVRTSGNTDTSTINAKFDSSIEKTQWRHALHAEALNSSSNNVTSAEKYLASAQSDYKFKAPDYFFGLVKFEKDLFSGFDYQATATAGYGRRVLDEKSMKLDVEIGPGIRFVKDKVTSITDSDPLVRLAAKYNWVLSENASFSENLSSDIGEDLTVTTSVTTLQANIDSALAMKFSFIVKNTSDVPVGAKKTDTETAVTLVYSF